MKNKGYAKFVGGGGGGGQIRCIMGDVQVAYCGRALCELAHYSTIAGKSQNLSDVISEARAVDWFSCYPGHSPLCDDIT